MLKTGSVRMIKKQHFILSVKLGYEKSEKKFDVGFVKKGSKKGVFWGKLSPNDFFGRKKRLCRRGGFGVFWAKIGSARILCKKIAKIYKFYSIFKGSIF